MTCAIVINNILTVHCSLSSIMQRSTSVRLFALYLLQQLAGYSSSQYDNSSLPVFPIPTMTSVSTASDVIPSSGESWRECDPTVPGCACFRPIADDNCTTITGETISNSSSRSSASPWNCMNLFGFELQSAISSLSADDIVSPVELSLYFDIGSENSSHQLVTSNSHFTQVLCRLRNVRRLEIRGLNDGVLVDDVIKPIVMCYRELEDLSIRQASISNWSELLSWWFRHRQLTLDELVSRSTSNSRHTGQVVRLDLSDSNIQSFDMELATLSLTELEILDLSGNHLTKMKKIKCHFENMSEIANWKMTEPKLDGLDNNIDSRAPIKFETANDSCIWSKVSDEFAVTLWSLNVSRNKIHSIDRGLFNFRFRNLVSLDLSYNSLLSLANGTFSDLYSLRSINLSHNNVADIDTEAFTTTSTSIFESDNNLASGRKAADREEQYYIRLASCTSGWLDIQVRQCNYICTGISNVKVMNTNNNNSILD